MTKLLTTLLLCCASLLVAQTLSDSISKKFSVDFGGFFGVFTPFKTSSKGFPDDKNQLGSNGVTAWWHLKEFYTLVRRGSKETKSENQSE